VRKKTKKPKKKERVQFVLAKEMHLGFDVDSHGFTPLALAIARGSKKVIPLLFQLEKMDKIIHDIPASFFRALK
jgi:hypothetical protein